MNKVRFSDLKFIPAGHEDKKDPGVLKKILFNEKVITGNGKLQMINWARLPRNKSFKAHYHEDMDEFFIIIKGTVDLKVADEFWRMETGDGVHIPMGEVHKMTNTGESDADYLVVGISFGQKGRTVNVE